MTLGQKLAMKHQISEPKNRQSTTTRYLILYCSGHLSAVRKWGGKTSDYAKSGGAKPKIHGKHK